MRVWILESQAEYEPATRLGVYATVNHAAAEFKDAANGLVYWADEFSVDVCYEFTNPQSDVTITIDHRGDQVTLTGTLVEGASYIFGSANVDDEIWAQVAILIKSFIRYQRDERGFKPHEANRPISQPTGRWHFVRQAD